MSDPRPALEPVDADLWVATRPLRLVVGDVGARMTVIRLGDELLLHSPVALDDATRAAVDAVGRVRWLLGPSKVHHLFLGEWAAAYPDAELCAAPGLSGKRRDLHFTHVLGAGPAPWGQRVPHVVFDGAPGLNEVVLFHPPSRTLVFTDLAFNLLPGAPDRARIFHWLVGATGRFGPHRIVRLAIRDRAAARRSLDRILAWEFDRVIVAHGDVLASGGRARMTDAFAYLAS